MNENTNLNENLKDFGIGNLTGLIFYIIYLEYAVGNIWWIDNTFNPLSIWEYIKHPFKNLLFWKPSFLDLNWLVWSTSFGILFTLLKN